MLSLFDTCNLNLSKVYLFDKSTRHRSVNRETECYFESAEYRATNKTKTGCFPVNQNCINFAAYKDWIQCNFPILLFEFLNGSHDKKNYDTEY